MGTSKQVKNANVSFAAEAYISTVWRRGSPAYIQAEVSTECY